MFEVEYDTHAPSPDQLLVELTEAYMSKTESGAGMQPPTPMKLANANC
jgi:hypothetical protein